MAKEKLAVGALLLLGVIFGLLIWGEVAVWNECRETHTFLYCLRTLG